MKSEDEQETFQTFSFNSNSLNTIQVKSKFKAPHQLTFAAVHAITQTLFGAYSLVKPGTTSQENSELPTN